jgi:hypothetical protein
MPAPPSTRPSIKIVHSFPYRGGTKEWSCRYFLTGSDFTSGQFDTLADAITADEKIIYGNEVTITEAVGYNAGSDVPVFTKSYAITGTLATSGSYRLPGDSAVMVRYSTDQRTSKNHPIYLWNWYHGARGATGDVGDDLLTLQHTHAEDFAAAAVAGWSDGTTTRHKCGPRGAVALGYFVNAYTHHRDFPN